MVAESLPMPMAIFSKENSGMAGSMDRERQPISALATCMKVPIIRICVMGRGSTGMLMAIRTKGNTYVALCTGREK